MDLMSFNRVIFSLQVAFDRLPQHRRLPGLLQHHQPRLVRQREGEVGSRDQGIVEKNVKNSTITLDQGKLGSDSRPVPSRRHSEGPQDRPGNDN